MKEIYLFMSTIGLAFMGVLIAIYSVVRLFFN